MARAIIDLDMLDRIERTALRAQATVQMSYQRLQLCLVDYRASEGAGIHAGIEAVRCNLLRAVADAVNTLTRRVLETLRDMCEIALANGALVRPAQQVLTAALSEAPGGSPVIALRKQRLLRLPVDAALAILVTELEEMCAEIDNLVASVQPEAEPAARQH
jgi:hypothetical protein